MSMDFRLFVILKLPDALLQKKNREFLFVIYVILSKISKVILLYFNSLLSFSGTDIQFSLTQLSLSIEMKHKSKEVHPDSIQELLFMISFHLVTQICCPQLFVLGLFLKNPESINELFFVH